jgi:hypothetical protein
MALSAILQPIIIGAYFARPSETPQIILQGCIWQKVFSIDVHFA